MELIKDKNLTAIHVKNLVQNDRNWKRGSNKRKKEIQNTIKKKSNENKYINPSELSSFSTAQVGYDHKKRVMLWIELFYNVFHFSTLIPLKRPFLRMKRLRN